MIIAESLEELLLKVGEEGSVYEHEKYKHSDEEREC